eukprot:2867129-Amphidinium_carterae.1
MLSGRSIVAFDCGYKSTKDIAGRCCSRLAIQGSSTESIVYGTEVLSATAQVRSWPGLRPGQVSEYQLVVAAA